MVQGGVAKHKPTFDQLLNKYTKAVPKDRPLRKDVKVTSALRQAFFS